MFNTQVFSKTPKAARFIKSLARLTPIRVSPEIEELAEQTDAKLVSLAERVSLASDEMDVMQYLLDRNHRAIIPLDGSKPSTYRNILLAASLSDSKRILVVVRDQLERENIIKGLSDFYPNDHVLTEVEQALDETNRHWFVCQYRQIGDTKFVSNLKIDHLVCLDHERSPPYDVVERIQILVKEIYRSTLTFRTTNFWLDFSNEANGSECIRVKDFIQSYFGELPYYLEAFCESRFSSKAIQYLRSDKRKYDLKAALLLSGFCVDAIEPSSRTAPRVIANDNFYRSPFNVSTKFDGRRREEIQSYHKAVKALEQNVGMSLDDIIDRTLQGDKTFIPKLDALKTKAWNKQKANMFFDYLRRSNNFDERTIVVSPFETTRRQITLTMRAIDVTPEHESAKKRIFGEFLSPDLNDSDYPIPDGVVKFNRIILVDDIKNLPDSVLMGATKIIFTEYPYTYGDIEDLQMLSSALQTELYFGWCRGTFEDTLVSLTKTNRNR